MDMRVKKQVDMGLAQTKRVLMDLLACAGGPTSLGVFLSLKYDDWESAQSHEIDPRCFEDPDDFADAYFAICLVKKLCGVPGFDDSFREDAAIRKYISVEDDLVDSDRRLRQLWSANLFVDQTRTIISMARDKIARVLGSLDLDDVSKGFRFGPGSSSSVRGVDVSVAKKMKFEGLELSTSCVPFLEAFCAQTRLGDELLNVTLKDHIQVITVPKNALTDRVIGIEPDFNIFVQLGFGAAIRRRLRRFGVDLDYGHSSNADSARDGSRDGTLATVDLSSASDRISYKLVRFLLPEDWFSALSACRTPAVNIGGSISPLRKFSSMGNGFTFELQSLIFWALTSSVCEYEGDEWWRVLVYGDDIVVPARSYERLVGVFSFLGFVINPKKSYKDGMFRESCGAHFFNGRNVKPIYLKECLHGTQSIYKIANALRLYCHRRFGVDVLRTRFRGCYKHLVSCLGRRVYRVPFGYGDIGLQSFFDEAVPSVYRHRVRDGWEGWRLPALLPHSQTVVHDSLNGLLAHLFTLDRRPLSAVSTSYVSPSDIGIRFPLRRSVRFRVGKFLAPSWDDPVVLR